VHDLKSANQPNGNRRQSSNPNGWPLGMRQASSAGFHRDLAEVWAKSGKNAMIWTAENQPAVFFATRARILPSDVKVSIEQTYGGLSPDDYAILRAIKQSLPEANSRSPEAILKFVEEAVREKAARPAIEAASEVVRSYKKLSILFSVIS
jgi:hypothetical protein